jgi:hypothetical protein
MKDIDDDPIVFPTAHKRNCTASTENFEKIPGSPVAYWVSAAIFQVFSNSRPISSIADFKHGMSTGKNAEVVRVWSEVDYTKIAFGCPDHEAFYSTGKRFVPYNKGGEYRKWYGNQRFVLGYDKQYDALMDSFSGHRHDNKLTYFNENISWSKVTSGGLAMRYFPQGFVYDVAGCSMFTEKEHLKYLLAFFNLKIKDILVASLSPTLNFEVGQLRNAPLIESEMQKSIIENLVDCCLEISRLDWDSFESSWDFKCHPFLTYKISGLLYDAFVNWQRFTENQYTCLKDNEEELNRIFDEIYGLQDELTPEVNDKDITVARIYNSKEDIPESMRGNNYVLTKSDVMKSFISYAVGCMFGRYSLDVDGLAYAGGEWDNSKYSTFIPDKDNVLPITDEEYFEDDVVGLFCAFLKKTFGEETLEENLGFIAKALGNKGNSSRDIIRNYFLKDFFKDHCKIYQKRPIYWLFDSGKADGFKALIYMHRYNEDTIGNLRIDYLHRMQRVYESEIARMQETIENSTNGREVTAATKRKEKLIKQLKETKEYDEKIAHLALSRIAIDLDDGVKVNYEKVQTGTDGKKLEVLAKI